MVLDYLTSKEGSLLLVHLVQPLFMKSFFLSRRHRERCHFCKTLQVLCIAFCSGLSQRTQRFPACLSSALLLLQTHQSPALLIPLCLCMWFPGTTLPRFTPRSSDLTQGLVLPGSLPVSPPSGGSALSMCTIALGVHLFLSLY